MYYTSTRDKSVKVTSSYAIAQGISKDGGLFVPCEIPKIDLNFINSLLNLSYIERAKKVLSLYLTDFTEEELSYCAEGAYKKGKFSSEKVAPVVRTAKGENILELWRGPTCAFKDMALQILPYLMTVSAKKANIDKTIVILVATSGDTGKAALEGFKDVEGTKIMVFYPDDGVSPMQKLQMTTQEGSNVAVSAIYGNFDDAQSAVKKIFTDKEVEKKLSENSMMFSSANSINWGRLVPQIVYYISAYCDLVEQGRISLGDEINVVVPTGNFGNILACYYARKMGLPVKKLICASNSNNVLTDFLKSGIYDKNRSFYTTISPSMDILISSNLERLLFDLTGENDEIIREWMNELSEKGKYEVTKEVKEKIFSVFEGGCCNDEETENTISDTFKDGYLLDTHTAVAVKVYRDYKSATGDETETVIASTANPYKFSKSVLSAISEKDLSDVDEFRQVELLMEESKAECPAQLSSLKGKAPRFTSVCEKEKMIDTVYAMLGIR